METQNGKRPLRLAYSSCPNDTFIFHAWVKGLLPEAPPVDERLEDIDRLNSLALAGEAEVVKLSLFAFAHVRDRYALLRSGAAMGWGCGPLVVASKSSLLRPATSPGQAAALADELARVRVAIPGELTTAALLVGLFTGGLRRPVVMRFDRIMPAVAAGEVDAGVIIHEGRFTFASHGLRRLVDLGEWWETTSGLPLPLGGIAVSRALPLSSQEKVQRAMRDSIEHATTRPEAAMPYVLEHAKELDPAVCRAHIDLYVNDFTLDCGPQGEAAIRSLLDTAYSLGLAPRSEASLFWDG